MSKNIENAQGVDIFFTYCFMYDFSYNFTSL